MHFSDTLITADATDETALLLANIDGRRKAGAGFAEVTEIRRVSQVPYVDVASAERVARRELEAWKAVAVPFCMAPGRHALLVAYDSGVWDGPEDE